MVSQAIGWMPLWLQWIISTIWCEWQFCWLTTEEHGLLLYFVEYLFCISVHRLKKNVKKKILLFSTFTTDVSGAENIDKVIGGLKQFEIELIVM